MTQIIIQIILVFALLALFATTVFSFSYTFMFDGSPEVPVLIIIGVVFLALFMFMNQKEVT